MLFADRLRPGLLSVCLVGQGIIIPEAWVGDSIPLKPHDYGTLEEGQNRYQGHNHNDHVMPLKDISVRLKITTLRDNEAVHHFIKLI